MPRCSLHVLSRGGPRVDPGHPGAVTHFCVATSGILLGTTGREPTSTFCTVWCFFPLMHKISRFFLGNASFYHEITTTFWLYHFLILIKESPD